MAKDKVAPIPAARVTLIHRLKSTLKSHSWSTPVYGRAGQERASVPDFGTCQSPAHASSSSSAFAFLRSAVSNPSVNQP
jgi:hypothetical protein